MPRHAWAAAGLIALLSVAGCASTEAGVTEQAGPSKVVPIQGTDRSQVLLTSESAKRIGLKTELVRAGAAGAAGTTVIPLDAVLYDKNGGTWAYTSRQPLTYVPERLTIARIAGNTAILRSGPPAGTAVVTVGGAELLGAEYGVSGE